MFITDATGYKNLEFKKKLYKSIRKREPGRSYEKAICTWYENYK